MNYPQELQDFWADSEVWVKINDPDEEFVTEEMKVVFLSHLSRLKPLADEGVDYAKYAMATIYMLEWIYSDERDRDDNIEQDQRAMTKLLCQCAENGMGVAFDNLVTSGIGEIANSARAAAKDYERSQKSGWDESSGMPVYTPEWMEAARKHWIKK